MKPEELGGSSRPVDLAASHLQSLPDVLGNYLVQIPLACVTPFPFPGQRCGLPLRSRTFCLSSSCWASLVYFSPVPDTDHEDHELLFPLLKDNPVAAYPEPVATHNGA